MNQPATNTNPAAPSGRWRFTYLLLGLSLAALAGTYFYSAWAASREREANLPIPAPEAVVAALRAFHQQTGRFPADFRELDARLWRGAKQGFISSDGKGLAALMSHYYYTLHTLNPAAGAENKEPVKAALWAVPIGPRAGEAATYFLYVTPANTEVWMGPALTEGNVGAVQGIPSEQQLALLVMTKQPAGSVKRSENSGGIFSLFGF
jgi:hypothetical protein